MNKTSQCAETGEYWNCLLVLSRLACLDCIVIVFSAEVPLLEKLQIQPVSSASWEKLKYRWKEGDFVDVILVLLDSVAFSCLSSPATVLSS